MKSAFMPKRIALLASATAVVFLLSGCFSFGGGADDTTSTPTGEEVSAELRPYYEQVLTWVDCDNDMLCTTAIAPLDWANPSPETDIELALVKHPATGTKQGSLFTNPGGPGASGYDFVHDSLDFATSADLQAAFDVVG